MIKKAENLAFVKKPAPFQGVGTISCKEFSKIPEELYGKGRFFGHTIIDAGSEIGYHVHENESETYYILSGRGIFNDNGTLLEVGPGDVTFTGDGEGHGLRAGNEGPVELIALILYHNDPFKRA